MDAPSTTIREVEEVAFRSWIVEVTRVGQSRRIQYTDPCSDIDREDIRWYLEDYAKHYPFDSQRASQARAVIDKYSRSLGVVRKLLPEIPQPQLQRIFVIESSSQQSLFHSLPWELLEDHKGPNSPNTIVFRKVVESSVSTPLNHAGIFAPKSTYRLLIAVSRPKGEKDISHRVLTQPLLRFFQNLAENTGIDIQMHVVRPGTWKAIRDHLENIKNVHGPGYYDLVHFDVHGIVSRGRACLDFLCQSGTRTFRVDVEYVASLLEDNGIRMVVTNACQTAQSTGDLASNFCHTLVSRGIEQALGMSFALSTRAAEIFMEAFYTSLITENGSMFSAASKARNALREDAARDARFGVKVNVSDFPIPVLYSRLVPNEKCSLNPISVPKLPQGVIESIRSRLRGIAFTFAQNLSLHPLIPNIPHDLPGRDGDILKLESQILLPQRTDVLLIHGAPGIGKSALAKHLIWWWQVTGLVKKTLFIEFNRPFQKFTVSQMIKEFFKSAPTQEFSTEDLYNLFIETLREEKNLLVIDNLDSGTLGTYYDASLYGEEDKTEFRHFIDAIRGGKSIILLTSRSEEAWLELTPPERYQLQGLSISVMNKIATDWLPASISESLSQQPEMSRILEQLLQRYEGNITTMDIFLLRLRLGEKTPLELYNESLLTESLTLSFSLRQNPSRDSFRRIVTANELCNRFVAENPDLENLLLSLIYFSPRFDEQWLEYILGDDRLSIELQIRPSVSAKQSISRFKRFWMDTGWMREETDFGLGQAQDRMYYIRLHPMMNRVLSQRFLTRGFKGKPELRLTIQVTMFFYFSGRFASADEPLLQRKARNETMMEYTNFITAVDIGLSLWTRRWAPDMTLILITRLWELSSTSKVDKKRLVLRTETAIELFQSDLEALNHDDVVSANGFELFLYCIYYIADHYRETQPQLARIRALGAIEHVKLFEGTDEVETTPELGFRQRAKVRLLMAAGLSCVNLGRFDEAATYLQKAFSLDLVREGWPLADGDIALRFSIAWGLFRLTTLDPLRFEHLKPLIKSIREEEEPVIGSVANRVIGSERPMFLNLWKMLKGEVSLHEVQMISQSHLLTFGSGSTFVALARAHYLEQQSSFEEARRILLEGLDKASKNVDIPAQAVFENALIGLAITEKKWTVAAVHIDRYDGLQQQARMTGGQWSLQFAAGEKCQTFSARGVCFLRLRQYDRAAEQMLKAFGHPKHYEKFVNDVNSRPEFAARGKKLEEAIKSMGTGTGAYSTAMLEEPRNLWTAELMEQCRDTMLTGMQDSEPETFATLGYMEKIVLVTLGVNLQLSLKNISGPECEEFLNETVWWTIEAEFGRPFPMEERLLYREQ